MDLVLKPSIDELQDAQTAGTASMPSRQGVRGKDLQFPRGTHGFAGAELVLGRKK